MPGARRAGHSFVMPRPRIFLLALLLPLTACQRDPDLRPFAIELVADPARPADAYIEVHGVNPRRLSTLEVFTVAVQNADGTPAAMPVAGKYTAAADAIRFTPLYPFDAGRSYRVRFTGDPAQPKAAPSEATVTLPAAPAGAPTAVTQVYPSGDVVPENQLRMYIQFSAPMGRRPGLPFISLLDDRGTVVVDPFLPVDGELWNADRTRFTVFFDPGRQKRGILPNREMGASLIAGRKYTLRIRREWLDGEGRPLRDTYERQFTVGPADRAPLDVAGWRISPPREGSRDPLVVTFPEPLDHGLLMRAVGVRRDGAPWPGDVRVDKHETRWTMTPREAWTTGRYELIALGILEDLAGNRIGRAFEITGSDDKAEDESKITTVPFTLTSP
jgi:hypothetical protein